MDHDITVDSVTADPIMTQACCLLLNPINIWRYCYSYSPNIQSHYGLHSCLRSYSSDGHSTRTKWPLTWDHSSRYVYRVMLHYYNQLLDIYVNYVIVFTESFYTTFCSRTYTKFINCVLISSVVYGVKKWVKR